jgi:hypothetical protein
MPFASSRLGFWGINSIPEFTIQPSSFNAFEDNNVTFFITTKYYYLPNLYWTVRSTSGNVNASDIVSGTTSGTAGVTVTGDNGVSSITLSIAEDNTVEGTETFVIDLKIDSINGPVVATSSPVTINELYYAFTPIYNYTSTGNAVPGTGMPGDYDPSTYGTIIWPAGGNGRWVGYAFIPTGNTVNFIGTSDNYFALYLNQSTFIASHGDWPSWRQFSFNVIPGVRQYLSFYLENYGGPFGFAARITNGDGSLITTTNTGWVSN